MKTKITKFEVAVPTTDGDGVAERVIVNIPVQWDEELQDWLLTAEAHRIIEDTKARLIGLILPEQMKGLRHRLGYTQRQMGELFQVGEKSWTRWETGKHRPTRSISLLIQALYDEQISVEYLLRKLGPEHRSKSSFSAPDPTWQTMFATVRQSGLQVPVRAVGYRLDEGFTRFGTSEHGKVLKVSFNRQDLKTEREKDEVIATAA